MVSLSPASLFRRLTALAAPFVVAALGCAAVEEPKPQPNVVLIVVDTLRVDHLGCYGQSRPTSPRIDALAADGVRYAHAYSQAPWTTPSVASFLTSLYPTEIGITERPDRLADRFVLLSELLRAHGWATGAVVSHYFLGAKWNLGQGFDLYDEHNVLGHDGICSAGVSDSALAFIDENRAGPWFLFAHYFDPHYDYIEHPEHPFSDPSYDGPVRSGMAYTELRDMGPRLAAADLAHLGALYDSEIAFTDRHIGRLLDGLAERGLYDDALIILTADHGEELMDRHTIGHGGTLYNELIHVPLIVKYPGREGAGRVVEGNVGLIDLYPTVTEYLQVALEHRVSGRSFLSGGPGSEPSPRLVFSETNWGHWRAVINGRMKLIRRLSNGRRFFFDLASDPGERRDLTTHQAQAGVGEDFRYLDERLAAWLAHLERSSAEAEKVEIDENLGRQLEALGYLE